MTGTITRTILAALMIATIAPAVKANSVLFYDEPPTADDILREIGRAPSVGHVPATPRRSAESRFGETQAIKTRSLTLSGSNVRLDAPHSANAERLSLAARSDAPPQPRLHGDSWFGELVQFTINNYDIRSSETGVIARVAEVLHREPGLTVIVSGHTDSSGTDAINGPLSQRRAEAVRTLLHVEFGVEFERIQIRHVGSTEPLEGLVANDPRNRRVQFGFPR